MKVESKKVRLRPAEISDANLLLEWRNDPETRYQSVSQEEVGAESHIDWLSKSLERDNRWLYIALAGNEPVGTCRADKKNNRFELSWTIAPNQRGKGYGKEMVISLSRLHFPFYAKVRKDNKASIKIALALGLKESAIDGEILIFE